MMDPYDLATSAEASAKQLIATTPGFEDLSQFSVSIYTDEDFEGEDIPTDWVGQYSRGSIDSPAGARVLINLCAPVLASLEEDNPSASITDTILHEMGHALWELLPQEAQEAWKLNQADHRWGSEEAFADDFMYLVRGDRLSMNNQDLFLAVAGQ